MSQEAYLFEDSIITFNKIVSDGAVINPVGLQSAVAQPRQGAFGADFHQSLYEKAAVLLRGIVRNHPFRDGNKRTALISADVFLACNGLEIRPPQTDLTQMMVDAAQGRTSIEEVAGHFQSWAVDLPTLEDESEPTPAGFRFRRIKGLGYPSLGKDQL